MPFPLFCVSGRVTNYKEAVSINTNEVVKSTGKSIVATSVQTVHLAMSVISSKSGNTREKRNIF